MRDWVWHSIGRLSETDRLVTLLRYFSDASSYEQIAAVCGVPIGTVRSRLSHARHALADGLRTAATAAHTDVGTASAALWRAGRDMVAAAMDGDFERVVRESWWPDAEMIVPGGPRGGRDLAINGMNRDLTAGVRQRLRNVVASGDVLIWETDLISPPDDPGTAHPRRCGCRCCARAGCVTSPSSTRPRAGLKKRHRPSELFGRPAHLVPVMHQLPCRRMPRGSDREIVHGFHQPRRRRPRAGRALSPSMVFGRSTTSPAPAGLRGALRRPRHRVGLPADAQSGRALHHGVRRAGGHRRLGWTRQPRRLPSRHVCPVPARGRRPSRPVPGVPPRHSTAVSSSSGTPSPTRTGSPVSPCTTRRPSPAPSSGARRWPVWPRTRSGTRTAPKRRRYRPPSGRSAARPTTSRWEAPCAPPCPRTSPTSGADRTSSPVPGRRPDLVEAGRRAGPTPFDVRENLGEITVPVVVIVGAYDFICGPAGRAVARGPSGLAAGRAGAQRTLRTRRAAGGVHRRRGGAAEALTRRVTPFPRSVRHTGQASGVVALHGHRLMHFRAP
ncbi:sigma factor-like helix-turn-helix DNA-binding protein [Micromonospora sp. M12]